MKHATMPCLMFFFSLMHALPVHANQQADQLIRAINIMAATTLKKHPAQQHIKTEPAANLQQMHNQTIRSINLIAQIAQKRRNRIYNWIKRTIHELRATKQAKKDKLPFNITHETVQLDLDKNNYPTHDAIKKLLFTKYFPNKFTGALEIKEGTGGAYTAKMYIAFIKGAINRPIFFLKISPKHTATETIKNLIALQQGPVGRLGIGKHYTDRTQKHRIPQNNLPIILWVEALFTYTGKDGKALGTIEMTHAAHGAEVNKIMTKGDRYSAEQKKCMDACGKAIGSFQQVFMNYNNAPTDPEQWSTVSHGDLHGNNILFDPKTLRVYFIDIERMQFNQPIINDLSIFSIYTSNVKELYVNISQLISGYINSFPDDKKAIMAKYLTDKINNLTYKDKNIKECQDFLGKIITDHTR